MKSYSSNIPTKYITKKVTFFKDEVWKTTTTTDRAAQESSLCEFVYWFILQLHSLPISIRLV